MPKLVERRGAIGIVLGSGDNESFKRKTDFSLQIGPFRIRLEEFNKNLRA